MGAEHPCEEAARCDLLDRLEDERLELLERHQETTAALIGEAINWINGERIPALPLPEPQEVAPTSTRSSTARSTDKGCDPADERAAERKLAAFGAKMLRAHRGYDASEVGDIDGGTAQDEAIACGVLETRTVTEPCGDSCVCVGIDDFPLECYLIPDNVSAFMVCQPAPTGGTKEQG